MINKKFVAIVLAAGLLLSIGFVVGQDKYAEEQKANELAAKELAAKELATKNQIIPGPGQPIDQTGEAPLMGDTTRGSVVEQTIVADYNISITSFGSTIIQCTTTGGIDVGTLQFVGNDTTLPQDLPRNFVGADHRITIYFPYSKYKDVLEMLEGDGDVYLGFYSVYPAIAWIGVHRTRSAI